MKQLLNDKLVYDRLLNGAAILTAFIVTIIGVRFVWQDSLGTFADDGVSYMIMAQNMSPYFSVGDVMQQANFFEKYPPVFPLILAILGISHSFLLSHIFVVFTYSAALMATFYLANYLIESKKIAFLLIVLFALCPSSWLNMMGILSENFYIFITTITIYFYIARFNKIDSSLNDSVVLGLLLAIVLLTRSVGVALLGAFVVSQTISNRSIKIFLSPKYFLPIIIPLSCIIFWHSIRVSAGPSLYSSDVFDVFYNVVHSDNIVRGLIDTIAPQAKGLYESWLAAFLIYWLDGFNIRVLIVILFAIIAAFGTFFRLKKNSIDAWYIIFYLSIILVWPYPEQTHRFLYAIFPLLIIHGGIGLTVIFSKFKDKFNPEKATVLSMLLLVVVVLPTTAFIYGRSQFVTAAEKMDYSRITQFYSFANLDKGKRFALENELLSQSLKRITDTTASEATIMWFTPNYIKLLSNRNAVRFPVSLDELTMLRAVRDRGAGYILVAKLNPRYTSDDYNGLLMLPLFKNFTNAKWVMGRPDADEIFSLLLKVDPVRLTENIARLEKL